jgi:sugar lactone lactonase YvrE
MIEQHLPPHTPEIVMAALHDLGVFKPGEEARTLHAHGCRFREGACTCPGGPELLFADWDERTPFRFYKSPERFNVIR